MNKPEMLSNCGKRFSAGEYQLPKKAVELHDLTNQEFAVAIKSLRLSCKWSQEKLAEIAGLSTRTIQRAEQGISSGIAMRESIMNALGGKNLQTY